MGNYIVGTSPQNEIKAIAFSGGGVCGIAHVGALKRLSELGMNFDEFAGASVGSIVASFCALGASITQLEQLMNFDFNPLLDDDYGVIRDCNRLWKECGYYKGDALYNRIRTSLSEVCGNPDVIFGDLKDKKLRIPVTLVWKSHCDTKVYSNETTPEVSIALACRMSCTYPTVFRSLESSSDGGILCNYPIDILSSPGIGLRIVCPRREEKVPVQNLSEYMTSIVSTLHTKANYRVYGAETIDIVCDVDAMDFSIDMEKRKELLLRGYNAVK